MISVIIITKNESKDLRRCLQSVQWADEIIVLDSGSTDDTISIAREFTSHLHSNSDWQGFGIQKNRALSYATKDWILSIDADEEVSIELKNEIINCISNNPFNVFNIPRSSSFCGKFIKHAGWSPDMVTRLFKRGHAKFSNDLVHEHLEHSEKAGNLKYPLLHYTYDNLSEVLEKINTYSSLGAQNSHNQGKQGGLTKAILHGVWAFLRTYVLRAGFLDGREGLMLAISNAETTYYRYLKLYYLTKK